MVKSRVSLSSRDYVCVMKAKQAELGCIEGVARTRFVPLYEVPDVAKAVGLGKKWGRSHDVCWIQPVNLGSTAGAAWAAIVDDIFATLRAAGVPAVPVMTLQDSATTQAAYAVAIAADGHGAVLRLDVEGIALISPAAFAAQVALVLQACGVRAADVDLVLDASFVTGSAAAAVVSVEACLGMVPKLGQWRSLVTAFSGLPPDAGSRVPKNSVGTFPRVDRAAYLRLCARGPRRVPTYGDFGIGSPFYPQGDPRFMRPVPYIKYTDVDVWQLHRANSNKGTGPQYLQLARDLVTAIYYRGANFGMGDAYISAVAAGTSSGQGTAMTYLRAGMNHHIRHVLDRLASHGEP